MSWGLVEAERMQSGRGYGDAAVRNTRWALTHQQANGWFDRCNLGDPSRPLTHTIGYVLRGLIEVYRLDGSRDLRDAACRTADGILSALRPDGSLPGGLDAGWGATASWSCLTGNVQIAHSLLILYEEIGNERYRSAAAGLNRYVRRTLRTDDPGETRAR